MYFFNLKDRSDSTLTITMPVPSRNARDGTAATNDPELLWLGYVEAARFLGG